MALDVVDAVLEVAKALRQVHLEQVTQQILQIRAEVRREADLREAGEPWGSKVNDDSKFEPFVQK